MTRIYFVYEYIDYSNRVLIDNLNYKFDIKLLDARSHLKFKKPGFFVNRVYPTAPFREGWVSIENVLKLSREVKKIGCSILNSRFASERDYNKALSMKTLKEGKIPVPETHICNSSREGREALKEIGKKSIIKPNTSGRSKNIHIIEDESYLDQNDVDWSKRQILQSYIEPPGFISRLNFIGDKHYSVRKFVSKKGITVTRDDPDYLGFEPYEPSEEALEIGKMAKKVLKADVVGFDMIENGAVYVIDVNTTPCFSPLVDYKQLFGFHPAEAFVELVENY